MEGAEILEILICQLEIGALNKATDHSKVRGLLVLAEKLDESQGEVLTMKVRARTGQRRLGQRSDETTYARR